MQSSLLSSILLDNGLKREVVFTLVDDLGFLHGPIVEFRPPGEDVNGFLSDCVTRAVVLLRDAEIDRNINDVLINGSLANPKLLYSTAAQNFAALRLVYQTSTQIQAVMIGDFLNTLTNAQLQTAFGMTAGQINTLRTNKLTPASNLATSIRNSLGQ